MYLDMAPDVGDGERSVLPDDIEDCARDGLRLLRRRCQLDRRHLWLPLLRRPPHCRREHSRLAAASEQWSVDYKIHEPTDTKI